MNVETALLCAILGLVLLALFARGGGANSARLRSIDRKLDLVLTNLGIDPGQGLDKQIADLLRSGQKIEAIKLYRAQTGVGLKEAKDYVEGLPGTG
ncbi:MAG: ribosomal protein L7/L12 [Pirellulales bacterium]